MSDRLERFCVCALIRLFGAGLFLAAPLKLVFTVCDDIGKIRAGYLPPPVFGEWPERPESVN